MSGLLAGHHVLVVENDVETCHLLRTVLEHDGARVSECVDAERALATVLMVPCDMIITDITLGHAKRDGIWLLERIRAVPRLTSLPVVGVTGFRQRRHEFAQLGFDLVVLKPIKADALPGWLSTIVRRR